MRFQVKFSNLAAPYTFARLWNAKHTWCSPCSTLWICFYGLEHSLKIHSFRPTSPCLIIEVLATWVKFLERSAYCIVINCTFTFHTTNVFGSFCNIRIQLWLNSQTKLCCTSICAALKSHTEWSNAQLSQYYQPQWVWLKLLQSPNICTTNLYVTKYFKTFDPLK